MINVQLLQLGLLLVGKFEGQPENMISRGKENGREALKRCHELGTEQSEEKDSTYVLQMFLLWGDGFEDYA